MRLLFFSTISSFLMVAFLSINAQPTDRNIASFNNRYTGLRQIVNCPADKAQYGTLKDFGYWSGKKWCGQQVSSGWWVYKYPNWYIWRKNSNMPPKHIQAASLGGKYNGLLKAIICPLDKEQYGMQKDFGYWGKRNRYCGHRVPRGYWVYYYPYWYIWKNKR